MSTGLMFTVIALIIYLGAMFYVGLKGRKFSQTNKDTMTAARQGTLIMVVGSYLGSHIGNGVVVGGAQNAAIYGLGGVWYGVGSAFSYLLFALVIAKVIYKENYVTLPDVLERKYGDKITVTLVAILHCAAMIAIMAGQIMAGKLLFEYLGLPGNVGAIITMIIVIIYSAASGLWGVMMTDAIQSVVIFIACIAGLFFILGNGGMSVMQANLPADNWNLVPFDAETLIMMFGPSMLYGLISAPGYQRTVSCKEESSVIKAPVIAALIIIVFAFIPVIFGMWGMAMWPDAEPNTILFKVLLEGFPPVLGALIVCAILAAVMSTCDGGLLSCSANVVNDIYLKVINPEEKDEKKLLQLTYAATIGIGVIATVVSLYFTNLVSLLSKAYSLLNSGALVMILGAVFWSKSTKQGAIASFIFGVGFTLLNNFGVITLPYASITPLIPSLIAFVVVSLATQPKKA